MRLALAGLAVTASLAAQEFGAELYPVFERAQCRLCHNDNGVASRTRLQFPAEDAAPAEIAAFARRLRAVVDSARPEESLLWRKPTNRTAHTGGERIRRGSDDERVLRAWIDRLARLPDPPAAASGARAGPQGPVRRLTHSQYNNTVRDLLGDQSRPADLFPPEDFVHGFTNQAEGQNLSPLLAEAYNRAAEKLARSAFLGGDARGLIPCRPAEPGCREQFIRAFGRRAFRRPLEEAEVRRYARLFDLEPDFLRGAQLIVEAMLQSPHFLLHMDAGPESYRVAARLSYFLWDTMPDEALLGAAESGELATAASIERTARRLLADPRARLSADAFLAQWMRFDRLRSAFRDMKTYPEYSAELVGAMLEETRRLFSHLVWENRSFLEFFTADYAFLNAGLAKLYEAPAPAEEFSLVRFPPSSERAGVLGQGTFLALTSKPADTSPTERGLFIREHFLCEIVPPPPPGVNTNLPPLSDDKPMSNRERMGIHLSQEACSGCHKLVDPIGFGLERFDAIGRFRAKQLVVIHPTFDEIKTRRKTKPSEHTLEIDPRGYFQGMPGSEFSSPREAGRILANDPGCRRCVVKQLFRYATGRPETAADQPAIEAALARFQDSQFRFQDLIIAVATSKPFLGGSEP